MARVRIEILDSEGNIVIKSLSKRKDDEPYPTLAEATAIKMIQLLQEDLAKNDVEVKHDH